MLGGLIASVNSICNSNSIRLLTVIFITKTQGGGGGGGGARLYHGGGETLSWGGGGGQVNEALRVLLIECSCSTLLIAG